MPKSAQKTVLFTPVLTGIAHMVRCLAVAERLKDCHSVVVVDPERFEFIGKLYKKMPDNIQIVPHKAYDFDDPELMKRTALYGLPSEMILGETNFYQGLVKKLKPSLVVGDSNIFGVMAAKMNNVPTVLLTTLTFMPYHVKSMQSSDSELTQITSDTLGAPIANLLVLNFIIEILRKYKQAGLYKFERGTKYFFDKLDKILFEDPEYTSLAKNPPHTYYFPLPIAAFETGSTQEFEKIKKLATGKRVAYVTLGGTGYNAKLCQRLVTEFIEAGYFVICSTAQIFNPSELPKSKNLYARKFVPGCIATAIADVVVSHGSQGTIAHAKLTNTPFIGIPFNIDQHLMLRVHKSSRVVNTLPLNMKDSVKTSLNPLWPSKLAGEKTQPSEIVKLANSFAPKPTSKKVFLKPKPDKELTEFLRSKMS